MDRSGLLVLRSRGTLPHKQRFFCSCSACCFSRYILLMYLQKRSVQLHFFVKILNYVKFITTAEAELPPNGSATRQAAMQNLKKQSEVVLNPPWCWMLSHTRLTCSGSDSGQRATLIYASKGVHHSSAIFNFTSVSILITEGAAL